MKEMLRRHGFNGLLVALAALAALAYLIVDRGSITTTESLQRAHHVFESLRQEEVTELSVNVGGRAAHMTRGALDDAGQRLWSVEIGGVRYGAEEQIRPNAHASPSRFFAGLVVREQSGACAAIIHSQTFFDPFWVVFRIEG